MLTKKEIKGMSIDDKLSTIELIWDSIDQKEADKIPLTKAQIKELDRRLDEYKQGKSKLYTWEEIKSGLKMK